MNFLNDDREPLPGECCSLCGRPVGDSWAWAGSYNPPRKFLLCRVCGLKLIYASSCQPVGPNRAERRRVARRSRR